MTEALTIPSTPTLRQADLLELKELLEQQRTQAIDVVVQANTLRVFGDQVQITGLEPVINERGVTQVDGLYRSTRVADEGWCDMLPPQVGYMRQCREEAMDLYQENLEGWLKRQKDDRRFMLRLLRPEIGPGMIRAVLSDTYGTYDNLDSLLALLAGLQESGVQNPVIHCDLTERRMVVRVAAPEIAAYAPRLMENYRSPFDGTDAGNGWTPDRVRQISEREGQLMDKPEVVFAGFVFTNSETGDGAWKINPQIIIKICGNGLTITAEALKRIHVGGKMEMGVQWAKDTEEANLQLIIKKTRDAVKHYLDVDFVTKQVKELEKLAGTPVKEPAEVIADVSKKLGFSKTMSDSIFAHFIRGGQTTAGGVMQAVSSVAQVVRDGEQALFMENRALQALELAAAAR